jgi:hypothetical protein
VGSGKWEVGSGKWEVGSGTDERVRVVCWRPDDSAILRAMMLSPSCAASRSGRITDGYGINYHLNESLASAHTKQRR